MKNILIITLLTFVSTMLAAQTIDASLVPDSMNQTLHSRYRHPRQLTWSLLPSGYEASFTIPGRKVFVQFSHEGSQIMNITEINKTRLPKPFVRALRSQYHSFILEYATIDYSGKQPVYQADIALPESEYLVTFNRKGEIDHAVPVDRY